MTKSSLRLWDKQILTIAGGDLTDAEHVEFARWEHAPIRTAWARGTNRPQSLIRSRIDIEDDPETLLALYVALDQVDENVARAALQRSRVHAYSALNAPTRTPEAELLLLRRLRHTDRGWLERNLVHGYVPAHFERFRALHPATIKLLITSLDVNVAAGHAQLCITPELQNLLLARLRSLQSNSRSATVLYQEAVNVAWGVEQLEQFENLVAGADNIIQEGVLLVRGYRANGHQAREVFAHCNRDWIDVRAALAADDTETACRILRTYPPRRQATQGGDSEDITRVFGTRIGIEILNHPGLSLADAVTVLPHVSATKANNWVRNLDVSTLDDHTAGQIAAHLLTDPSRNGIRDGALIQTVLRERSGGLRAMFETLADKSPSVLESGQLILAVGQWVTTDDLRWVYTNGWCSAGVVVKLPAGKPLLADLPLDNIKNQPAVLAAVLDVARAKLPANRLADVGALLPDWAGTGNELVDVVALLD